MDMNLDKIKKEVYLDKRRYYNTLLLFPIQQAITENKEIHIISDFLIVDKFRNMEKGQFGRGIPRLADITSEKEIMRYYLNVPRMDYITKKRLRAFWNKVFNGSSLGDGKFASSK
jgi:hypothetical protein